jgi:hypothetical protein
MSELEEEDEIDVADLLSFDVDLTLIYFFSIPKINNHGKNKRQEISGKSNRRHSPCHRSDQAKQLTCNKPTSNPSKPTF